MLDVLELLCDDNLLTASRSLTGQVRYGLLASIQEYANAKLKEKQHFEERHARCFARFSSWIEQNQQAEQIKHLQLNLENLIAAVKRGCRRGRTAMLLGRHAHPENDWTNVTGHRANGPFPQA